MFFLGEDEEKHWQHWEDLPDEAEDRLLENMARFFMDRDLGLLAQILLESGEPLTRIFATLGMGMFGPFLEFLGVDTHTAFFRKDGNSRRLLERIEELEDEKRIKKDRKKEG